MNPDRMTLAQHAEAWWREQGNTVPPPNTPEWTAMYERWHAFAFALPLEKDPLRRKRSRA